MYFKLVTLVALTFAMALATEDAALEVRGERDLQEIEMCALPHSPGSVRNFIIVNVNAKSDGKLRWLPRGDAKITFSNNRGTMKMDWEVYPQDHPEGPYMTVKATFSGRTDYNDCWCANAPFNKDTEDPNYSKVQNSCTQKNFVFNRDEEEQQFIFCPKCEGDVCNEANKKRDQIGSPKPIWANWDFYTIVDGELGGEGLALFRETIVELYPEVDPNIETCTMDIRNVPLPQFDCSNMDNPPEGYGFGANAKNLECGFATWFNCQEDIEALGGDEVIVHEGDINFNFGPCPTPEPTPAPQELCVTTPPSCAEYQNADGDNYCSTEENCEGDFIFDTNDKGRGCTKSSTNNDDSCGCCRRPTPAPTPKPTKSPQPQCVSTPDQCAEQAGFCAVEVDCPIGSKFVTSDRGQGCTRSSTGNDGDCGCCIPETNVVCPTTPPSCGSTGDGSFCASATDCNSIGGFFDTGDDGKGCGGDGQNSEDCGCCRLQTPDPTPEPTPFPSELCIQTPDECKFHNNDAGENFCSTEENCPSDFTFDNSNRGRGCRRTSTGNDGSCGCCKPPTPEPTPQPTDAPQERCVVTPPECATFDNEDGDNFCSVEESCPDGYVFDTRDRGRGCNRGSTGNDGSCGCCRKPVLCVDEPCCKKIVNIIEECNDVDGKLCPFEEL